MKRATRGKRGPNPPSARIVQEGGSFIPLPSRGRGAQLRAEQTNDFRPGVDRVVRDTDGRVWVVDGERRYAPIQVWEPPVSELPPLDPRLTPAQIRGLYQATASTPYLSEEGREERLASLRPLLPSPFEVVS